MIKPIGCLRTRKAQGSNVFVDRAGHYNSRKLLDTVKNMKKLLSLPALVSILLTSVISLTPADTRPAAEDRGASGLALTLRRLQTIECVLHTGAHPDDESTELLAYLARAEGARVAYLSLNRGEGGQNGIG